MLGQDKGHGLVAPSSRPLSRLEGRFESKRREEVALLLSAFAWAGRLEDAFSTGSPKCFPSPLLAILPEVRFLIMCYCVRPNASL